MILNFSKIDIDEDDDTGMHPIYTCKTSVCPQMRGIPDVMLFVKFNNNHNDKEFP